MPALKQLYIWDDASQKSVPRNGPTGQSIMHNLPSRTDQAHKMRDAQKAIPRSAKPARTKPKTKPARTKPKTKPSRPARTKPKTKPSKPARTKPKTKPSKPAPDQAEQARPDQAQDQAEQDEAQVSPPS